MQVITKEIVCELEAFKHIMKMPWFQNLGSMQPIEHERLVAVKEVGEFEQRLYGQIKWSNFKRIYVNHIRRLEFEVDRYNNSETNSVQRIVLSGIQALLNNIKPVLQEKLTLHSAAQYTYECAATNFQGDLLHYVKEAVLEYLGFSPIRFYSTLIMPAYALGRFPCGWTGKMPKSGLVPELDELLASGKVCVF